MRPSQKYIRPHMRTLAARERVVMRLYSALVASCALFMPSITQAKNCPALLERARRLVLVTIDSVTSSSATLRLFKRASAGGDWRPVHPPEPAVLGVDGAAWGPGYRHLAGPGDPVKTEGDNRTPAGIFAFGRPFGFAPSPLPHYLQLKPNTVCVDDPTSGAYNTITSRKNVPEGATVEYMRKGALYRRGLVVVYPTNAATGSGSCIFIHVWRSPTSGTAGCIALSEVRVAALQKFVAQGSAVLAVLPDEAVDRLANCLPPVTGKPQ